MIHRLLVVFIVTLAILVRPSLADERLETLPGYERYKLVTDNLEKLNATGRITRLEWSDDGTTLTFRRDSTRCVFDLGKGEMRGPDEGDASSQPATSSQADSPPQTRPATRPGRRAGNPGRGQQRSAERSPDGQWLAACRDYNVVIEGVEKEEGEKGTIRVTTTGTQKFRYGKASWVYGEELDQHDAMWWSSDSSKLAFYEFDERLVKDFFLLRGWSELRTEPETEGYPKPGEPNPIAGLLVFDVNSRKTTRIEVGGDLEQYAYNVRWSPEGKELLFSRTNRHQNILEVCVADPATGAIRVVVRETQETFQNNRPEMKFLEDGHRFIWETEKTGWKHYELRDLDGSLITTLTTGEYPADAIVKVDEEHGQLFYTAFSGAIAISLQLNCVKLDGTGQRVLTDPKFNHTIRLSEDGHWFVDEYETTETPPATALRNMNGDLVAMLAESDYSKFEELGLLKPELLAFKAADGETTLHGFLHKPSNFDATKTYPLLVEVYGGPAVPGLRNKWNAANAGCEFGYLIAKFENRGLTNRGKTFENVTYLHLGGADLDDQVAGVKFLTQRPYVDARRVGIVGSSYGGYMSALAMLRYPDVFHAAVAGSAVTHWKNYDTIYTERYMRTPQENPDGYEESSCAHYADQLRGKLLMIHGMVDDNVHPTNAWQLIDALNKKNKPFEMMFYPNSAHSVGSTSRTVRWEFFHRTLIEPFEPARSMNEAVRAN